MFDVHVKYEPGRPFHYSKMVYRDRKQGFGIETIEHKLV